MRKTRFDGGCYHLIGSHFNCHGLFPLLEKGIIARTDSDHPPGMSYYVNDTMSISSLVSPLILWNNGWKYTEWDLGKTRSRCLEKHGVALTSTGRYDNIIA